MSSLSQQFTNLFRQKLSTNALSQITVEWLDGFVRKDILNKTAEGVSPTKGNNFFAPYNEKYDRYKGRRSAHATGRVNLRFTDGVPQIEQIDPMKMPSGASLEWNRNGDVLSLHDKGLDNMPKRQIIPHNEEQIPEAWKEALLEEIANAFK